jgi:hypothetical protein
MEGNKVHLLLPRIDNRRLEHCLWLRMNQGASELFQKLLKAKASALGWEEDLAGPSELCIPTPVSFSGGGFSSSGDVSIYLRSVVCDSNCYLLSSCPLLSEVVEKACLPQACWCLGVFIAFCS